MRIMQAAAVQRWLWQTKGVAVRDDWLEACVEWVLSEEEDNISQGTLQELVYEQWLHADLRDVTVNQCIPHCVAEQQNCQINGRFIVQVDSIMDVGSPAYSQLQKLKGQSLNTADSPQDKKYSEPKPHRLLLLSLTDGMYDLQAMEYQPIPQFNAQVLPGTKLQLVGEIYCRLGILMLHADCVQVLGGKVEALMERNEQKKVLARMLNLEDPGDTEQDRRHEQQSDSTRPPNTDDDVIIVDVSPQARESAHGGMLRESSTTSRPRTTLSHQSSVLDDRPGPSGVRGVSTDTLRQGEDDDLDDMVGYVDLTDFDEFDTDEQLDHQLGNTHQGQDCVGGQDFVHLEDAQDWGEEEQEWVHVEDGQEWGEEGEYFNQEGELEQDFDVEDRMCMKNDIPARSAREQRPTSYLMSNERNSMKSLNLRQKSPELGSKGPVRKPLIASVKPLTRELPAQGLGGVSRAGTCEEPVSLTLSDLQSETVWKLYSVVKVKARIIKVLKKLKPDTAAQWMITVELGDESGAKLSVHLSNQLLETLLGFSALEFVQELRPNKSNPIIQARLTKGTKHAESVFASLNCFMEVRKRNTHELPFVEKLLKY